MNEFIFKRKEKIEYAPFTCRIERKLLNQIRTIVNENDLKSINQFINDSIRFAIDNIKDENHK